MSSTYLDHDIQKQGRRYYNDSKMCRRRNIKFVEHNNLELLDQKLTQ